MQNIKISSKNIKPKYQNVTIYQNTKKTWEVGGPPYCYYCRTLPPMPATGRQYTTSTIHARGKTERSTYDHSDAKIRPPQVPHTIIEIAHIRGGIPKPILSQKGRHNKSGGLGKIIPVDILLHRRIARCLHHVILVVEKIGLETSEGVCLSCVLTLPPLDLHGRTRLHKPSILQ